MQIEQQETTSNIATVVVYRDLMGPFRSLNHDHANAPFRSCCKARTASYTARAASNTVNCSSKDESRCICLLAVTA
jgi:hypothetical protein